MNRRSSVILPPFIGSLVLTSLAYYDQTTIEKSNLDACEVLDLYSTSDFAMMFIIIAAVGGLMQFLVVEPIVDKFNVHKVGQWLTLGLVLTAVFGLGITLIGWIDEIWNYGMDIKYLVEPYLAGCAIGAIYVVTNLTASGIIKNNKRHITTE